ncbi:MAG: nucleotidyltransferase family protein [Treponema sp.]|jgi:molybdenum cofactor cytidylyltransferase|nr:nucleotidyltransferase family protein [Treponema sp.]
MKSPDAVDAVLMASGFSKRFGNADKLLIPFQGRPLARHTLELACGLSCFHRIFFIAATDAVSALARDMPVRILKNERPERGQRESIRLGALASSADYYLFFPCDQPGLDRDTVLRLLEARKPGCIVQPAFQGVPGSPALFSNAFRDELLSLAPGEHGRDIKRRHPKSLITVELKRRGPLLDIDNPDMLENLLTGAL